MKKSSLRIVSVALAASMLAAGCGSTNELTQVDAVDQSIEQIATVATIASAQSTDPNDTVYVITKADGEINKVFDNGESSLPVDIKITYKLDGVSISPEDLSGKSGHVSIRFDYANNAKRDVEVNGETETMYVPFAVVSGLVLDDAKFTNVEVKNGKVVDDGSRTVAIGLSLPGFKENLGIDSDALNIPDYVEIEADVTNFSLEMTLSIVTNDVFSELEDKHIESLDSLDDSIEKLNDAMTQLLDGSSQLYDGLDTLYTKVGELGSGVNQLYTGSEQLKDGASKVANGASQLSSGASELSNGLGQITTNNAALNSAAAQVFNSLLATASSQLQANGFNVTLTIENYASTLDNLIASVGGIAYNQALNNVTAAVEANNDAIVANVTSAVRANVTSQVTAAARAQAEAQVKEYVYTTNGITDETFSQLPEDDQAAINAAIASNVEAQMQSEATQTAIANEVETRMASPEVQEAINANVAATKQGLIAENMESAEVQNGIQSGTDSAVATLSYVKSSLDSYYQFYSGLQAYTAAVSKAADGAAKLSAGAAELSTGAQTLYEGTVTLNEGLATVNAAMPELSSGVEQLRDGSGALSDGLVQFNEEGISKITDVLSNDIEGLVNRFEASVNLAKDYKNEKSESENSAIKFIYRSESIN